jgi:hypothetical protein
MNLCRYQNVFGAPKEGVHSYRFLNLAVVDVGGTVFIAFLISYFFKLPFLQTCAVCFVLGIVLHRLFCVRTTVDRLLFG